MSAIAETILAALAVVAVFAVAAAAGWLAGRCADYLDRSRDWRDRDAQAWRDARDANRRTTERLRRK